MHKKFLRTSVLTLGLILAGVISQTQDSQAVSLAAQLEANVEVEHSARQNRAFLTVW